MSKKKKIGPGSKGKVADAEAWRDPGMMALDKMLTEVLKVPKAEIDKRESELRSKREG